MNTQPPNSESEYWSLAKISESVLRDFSSRYPECDEYLGAALRVLDELDHLSLESIERDYHADARLPDAPDRCYHAKDLVVHPATVILLTREPDGEMTRGRITAEIQEVRAHTGQVRAMLATAN